MLDNIMYGLKIVVLFTAIYSIRKLANGKSSGLLSFTLFGIACFMTGMEMISSTDTPWQFLFYEGHFSEWKQAMMGGFVMLVLPVILYVWVGKDIEKLLGYIDK